MSDFAAALRSAVGVGDDPASPSVLTRPATDLLGVSDAAGQALAAVGIDTIFDLAASNLFASARSLVDYAAASQSNGLDLVPGDLLADGPSVVAPGDIAGMPLVRLRLLTAEQGQTLSAALDVATVADLANWPPHREARRLLGESTGTTEDPEDQQADELRPRFGQFPTERVYYSTLVLLEMLGHGGPLQELTGPVSLAAAVKQPGGMTRPAIGALLTFEQSWFAQGVTLGHMLHSLSLAPGEVTRVAMSDWSRRTRAFASEVIGETEQLDSATTHARALSEVQSSVANDFQQGGSSASSSATSSSHGEAGAHGSGLLQSLVMSGDDSSTDQTATTTAQADSSSWSLGNRSITGSLTQNVNDRTEQHSSSVRNRRATAVREVSQSESEGESTRVVANYNHMHVLNMQYYEVVQIYRTEARLHRADRCLFLPMETLSFAGESGWAVVERFRGALLAAALNNRVRSLLADDTTAVEVTPARRLYLLGVWQDLGAVHGVMTAPGPRGIGPEAVLIDRAGGGSQDGGATATTETAPPSTVPPSARIKVPLWDPNALAKASRLVDRPLVRPNSDSLFVPDDTELIGVSFDGVAIRTVRIDHVGKVASEDQNFTVPSDSGHIDIVPGVRFVELDAISVTKADDPAGQGGMTLHCAYLGRRFTLPIISLDLARGVAPQTVATLSNDQADRRRELQQHLDNNQAYYSHAIFRGLDAATLTFVLSGYQLNGRPLIDQVEPRSITIAGNYIVLRAPIADDEPSGVTANGQPLTWHALLQQRGLDRSQALDRRLIPIPTGGVFAEAVLGRSNSAEKLDMTRFWHWADSPIPIQPTEIAPVQTGSRATPEGLTPGQLSAPVVNIQTPTSLPEPTSMSAMLNALASLNFRDMSGLAGTQGLVKAAEAGTLDAATAAGKLASDNMKTEAQKAVSMGQIAADIAKAAIAADAAKAQAKIGGGGGGGGAGGISRDGAVLNQGRKMDNEAAATSATGGPSDSAAPSGSGDGASDGSAGAGSSGGGPEMMTTSHEAQAFQNTLRGSLGGSDLYGAQVMLAAAHADTAGGPGAGSGAGGGGGSTAPPAKHPVITEILDRVKASGLVTLDWGGNIGVAPIGYLNGMALTYARVYCAYQGGIDGLVKKMAKTPQWDADVKKDAVAKYADRFFQFGADFSVDGVHVLRAVFTILFGLGMRESSGKFCAGWDTSKLKEDPPKDPTATNSEAGLFQISFDLPIDRSDFNGLVKRYQSRPIGLLDVFRQGVTCAVPGIDGGAIFGKDTDEGKKFQQFSKNFPAFTVELAALGIRSTAKSWGPIKNDHVPIRQECWSLLGDIEDAIDNLGGCLALD